MICLRRSLWSRESFFLLSTGAGAGAGVVVGLGAGAGGGGGGRRIVRAYKNLKDGTSED